MVGIHGNETDRVTAAVSILDHEETVIKMPSGLAEADKVGDCILIFGWGDSRDMMPYKSENVDRLMDSMSTCRCPTTPAESRHRAHQLPEPQSSRRCASRQAGRQRITALSSLSGSIDPCAGLALSCLKSFQLCEDILTSV